MSTVSALSVGVPRRLRTLSGGEILTGFLKEAVGGPVAVGPDGLAGDGQADPIAHGGPERAVCVYAREHYAYWEGQLGRPLPENAFGENLTTEGVVEDDVRIGDVVRIGSALLQVAQPRTPCFKIAARHGLPQFTAWVWRTGYTGWFFRVLEPGELAAGDPIEPVERAPHDVTVARLNHLAAGLAFGGEVDLDFLREAVALPELAHVWRAGLSSRAPAPAPRST